jgi:hypothetical protein
MRPTKEKKRRGRKIKQNVKEKKEVKKISELIKVTN